MVELHASLTHGQARIDTIERRLDIVREHIEPPDDSPKSKKLKPQIVGQSGTAPAQYGDVW